MILDLARFVAAERPAWNELEGFLDRFEADAAYRLDLEQARRFHLLYQRASADLARIATFAAEPDLHRYLESLVGRAYAEIHETRTRPHRLQLGRWFRRTFPRTFRRHLRPFLLSLGVTLLGAVFGAGAMLVDPNAKSVIVPFQGLAGDPTDRVAAEESASSDRLDGHRLAFSAQLMTHNTQVSIFALALGMSFGIGTLLLLFYNGVILGAVALDYIRASQSVFLAGWLLPHGSIEIPSILIAGQAGLLLGSTLVGWGSRLEVKDRLRAVGPDLVTLIGGVAVLLVWAGIIEAFLSQYHAPTVPYAVKIAFGVAELVALTLFLSLAGAKDDDDDAASTTGRGAL